MNAATYENGCAWVSGQFVPIEQAAIPITDTGFTRSDLTYDVVAVWDGAFFRLDDHLQRFQQGWERLRMTPTTSVDDMRAIVTECVVRSELRQAYVEMIVTRGIPVAGDRDPRNFVNRFYAFAIPYVWISTPEQQQEGLPVVVAQSTHRIPPECVDPEVKNFHWGDLVRGLFEAYDRDAQTAILLDADGRVTEGPGFNVFAFSGGTLMTPPSGVLQGITRATVIDLAEEQGIPVAIEPFSADDLTGADEIFLTSTAGGVMPVNEIDGKRIGDGRPGPVTAALRELYWDAHTREEWTTPVNYRDTLLESVG